MKNIKYLLEKKLFYLYLVLFMEKEKENLAPSWFASITTAKMEKKTNCPRKELKQINNA